MYMNTKTIKRFTNGPLATIERYSLLLSTHTTYKLLCRFDVTWFTESVCWEEYFTTS